MTRAVWGAVCDWFWNGVVFRFYEWRDPEPKPSSEAQVRAAWIGKHRRRP